MQPVYKHPTDAAIISMLAQNNNIVWGHIYNKYASIMYGIIYNMCGNETTSAQILTAVFLALKEKNLLSGIQTGLCHNLIRHTHQLAIMHLTRQGAYTVDHQSLDVKYPSVNSFYLKLAYVNETGMTADLTKQEILMNLRKEFNHIRHEG